MVTPILLTIGMYIRSTKLLEVGLLNAEYDLEEKLCEWCTDTNCDDDGEIEEAMAVDNNKNNNKDDL